MRWALLGRDEVIGRSARVLTEGTRSIEFAEEVLGHSLEHTGARSLWQKTGGSPLFVRERLSQLNDEETPAHELMALSEPIGSPWQCAFARRGRSRASSTGA